MILIKEEKEEKEKKEEEKEKLVSEERKRKFFGLDYDNNENKSKIQSTPLTRQTLKIELSEKQKKVLNCVLEGKSVFFTGAAGTGKSLLLNYIINKLKSIYSYTDIGITASTGIAAINISGCTLHSFLGLGLARENLDILKRKISRNNGAKNRWNSTKVLIIDENSFSSYSKSNSNSVLEKISVRSNNVNDTFVSDIIKVKSPLCMACKKGNESIVNYLVEHGADINAKYEYLNSKKLEIVTPLMYACKSGNESGRKS